MNATLAPISTETPTQPPTQPPTPTQEPTATPAQTPTATQTKAPVPAPEGVLTQIQFEALIIDEYLLDGPPDISQEMLAFEFVEGDKKEILQKTESYRDYQVQIKQYNNRALEPFGYSKERFNIYKSGEVIARNIFWMQPVSVNASKTNFIVDVGNFAGGTYVLTRDSFEKRTSSGREAQCYVGDRMLSIESIQTDHQQYTFSVYLDNTLAYRSEFHLGTATFATYLGPWSYDNHWAIALLDSKKAGKDDWEPFNRIVLDGKDLNSLYGYQETFQFTLLGGHPFYFYQRNEKIGISFDGKRISREYDEIPHYNCCSPALLNPRSSMNMIWFFAKRGPNWYYVEAYIPIDTEK
jgi:hypothetical protein